MKTADREYIKEAVRRGEIKEEDAKELLQELEDGDFVQCYGPDMRPIKTPGTDH